MVNYQDPVTIEKDFSTYAFLSLTDRQASVARSPIYWSVSLIAALVKILHVGLGIYM